MKRISFHLANIIQVFLYCSQADAFKLPYDPGRFTGTVVETTDIKNFANYHVLRNYPINRKSDNHALLTMPETSVRDEGEELTDFARQYFISVGRPAWKNSRRLDKLTVWAQYEKSKHKKKCAQTLRIWFQPYLPPFLRQRLRREIVSCCVARAFLKYL